MRCPHCGKEIETQQKRAAESRWSSMTGAERAASDVPGNPVTFDVTSYGRHEARGFNPSPVASAVTGIPIRHWPGSWMMDNPIGRPKRKAEFKDIRGRIVCTRWI